MTRASLSPAVRGLLVQCIESGVWRVRDRGHVRASTVEAAERRGLVAVERLDGAISAATITALGRAEMSWT